jgi:hypothetical protein
MERQGLLALAIASAAVGGCAGLFGRAEPSSYGYTRGQGQLVFRLPLAVVVEELDRTLTDDGAQVTFRHIDRHGAVVKAKTKEGKNLEATLQVDGMLTQLSLKVGRWGDRETTEILLGKIDRGVKSPSTESKPIGSDDQSPNRPPELKEAKGRTQRGEARELEPDAEQPNSTTRHDRPRSSPNAARSQETERLFPTTNGPIPRPGVAG